MWGLVGGLRYYSELLCVLAEQPTSAPSAAAAGALTKAHGTARW